MASSTLGTEPDFARATDFAGVLERMQAIDASSSRCDGVATFNRMYREVTRLIRQAVAAGEFVSAEFLGRLDVNFANHFFAAYAEAALGQPVRPAWRPLFEARSRPDIEPIQFAFAGMNAHISHDLAFAVVETCQQVGVAPRSDSPEHADFTRTNDVLAAATDEVKRWFLDGVVAEMDEAIGPLDDAIAAHGIHLSRAAAWDSAEVLWSLDDDPHLRAMFCATLARTVELASRALLL